MNSSLLNARAVGTLNWTQTNPVAGFDPSGQTGTLFVSKSPTIHAIAATAVFQVSGILAAGLGVTVDLYSFTDAAFGQALLAERGYSIGFRGDGATWRFGPAAALGLPWFLGGTTPFVQGGAGEGFVFVGGTAVTINNGVKQMTITNTHVSANLTYRLAAILGAP